MKDMEEIPCDAYTVGWVCVTKPEYLAAHALLDQEFQLPPIPNDNIYLVGRMGEHNIVIAKSRAIGQSAAVSAATKMVNNFKNIRFVLMVGIGGGATNAPDDSSKSGLGDIMLGDVVVSTSSDNHGGVLQYDMGKQTNKGFEIRYHLNKPFGLLTDAVSKLWLKHKRRGGMADMQCSIQKAVKDVSGFEFPGRAEDRLFKSDYQCQTEEESVCNKCSQEFVVSPRETRDTDLPKIHHGLIGSANTVMKYAERRDSMCQSHKVLCFEMEAASLMDNFPCIVIRGISDYADSHKNNRWHYYAALAAAAYAKDLLDIIPPKHVDKAEAVWSILGAVHDGVQKLDQNMGVLNEKIDHNQRNIILNMLGNFDFACGPEVTLESHVPTEAWLTEHEVFKTWIDGSKWDLRLYGEAGIGKTYLCAFVEKYLKDRYSGFPQGPQLRPVIHIYLNDTMIQTQEQKRDNILKSLVKQLILIEENYLPTSLTNMSLGNPLGESTTKNMFEELLGRYTRTYLIIDGLSQCNDEVRNLLEEYPLSLIKKGFALSLLTTSHNYLKVLKEIDCDIPNCPRKKLSIFFHFSCNCNGEDFDICQECKLKGLSCSKVEHNCYETYETVYIDVFPQKDAVKRFCLQTLEQASLKPRQSDDRQHDQPYHKSALVRYIRENQGSVEPIAERIALHAQGNFQIAKIWLEDWMSKKKVPRILDDLIDELDRLPLERLNKYLMDRIESMKSYKSDNFLLALDVISMVITAFHPINVSALQHALALRRETYICKDDLKDTEAILMATNGLLRIARADDANSLVHLFDGSMRSISRVDPDGYESFQNLHTKMARLCLQYLEHEDYSLHSTDLVEYPFLAYVLDHWADHVREASLETCFEKEIKHRVTKFLKNREKACEIGQKASERHPRGSTPFVWLSKASYGLHLCAWYNLSELVEEFHPDYSLLDLRERKTPLQYACTNGSLETAKTLLRCLKWSPQTSLVEIREAVQDAIVGYGLHEQG